MVTALPSVTSLSSRATQWRVQEMNEGGAEGAASGASGKIFALPRPLLVARNFGSDYL